MGFYVDNRHLFSPELIGQGCYPPNADYVANPRGPLKNLKHFWLFNRPEPRDLVGVNHLALTGSNEMRGNRMRFTAIQDSNYIRTPINVPTTTTPFNFTIQFRCQWVYDTGALFQWAQYVGDGGPILYISSNLNDLRTFFDGAYIWQHTLGSGEFHTIMFTGRSDGFYAMYTDGILRGSSTDASWLGGDQDTELWFNNGYDDDQSITTDWEYAFFAREYTPPNLARELYANPYQLIAAKGGY